MRRLWTHLIEKRVQVVGLGCDWLGDDPPALLANVHRLIEAKRRGRHHGRGIRTAALLPHFLTNVLILVICEG